jgi:RNA polymerase sigma-70 factor (ECF subfamily)
VRRQSARDDAEQRRRRWRAEERTDAELLAGVSEGDLSLLGVLYDRHCENVKRFALRASGSAALADDITQEAFLARARGAHRCDRSSATARPLLLGIAAKLMQTRWRRWTRWGEVLRSFAAAATDRRAPTPEEEASATEEVRRFNEALAQLPEKKRLVVLLVEGEGLAGEDVARALDIPIGTVWSRLHGAREELRRALACEQGAPR